MRIYNPAGRDDFSSINVVGGDASTIRGIWATNQITLNVPSIICQQFPQTTFFHLMNCSISIITQRSFQYCHSLVTLRLNGNHIAHLPDFMLPPQLDIDEVFLSNNGIVSISPRAFFGVHQMRRLDLQMNHLTELPFGLIDGPIVSILVISDNNISTIDSRSFGSSLAFLGQVTAVNSGISSIDPIWFDEALNLWTINLQGNICVSTMQGEIIHRRNETRQSLEPCFANFNP